MHEMLKRFGITDDLLSRHNTPNLKATGGAPSREEMFSAVECLAPRSVGVDLVRLGGSLDGGYLLPDDLEGIEACFSPGTNNFKRFEDELANRFGIKSFMCDFTSSVEQFETPLVPGVQFFEKKWLDIDHSADALDINIWVGDNTKPGTDLILQMDIESAEYRNLMFASDETMKRFRIIVMEIHDLHLLADSEFLNLVYKPAMAAILKNHVCVHLHANNACGQVELAPGLSVPAAVEATFFRKDRCQPDPRPVQIPHPLDELNVNGSPPLPLSAPITKFADPSVSRVADLEVQVRWLMDRMEPMQRLTQFMATRGQNGNIARGAVATQSSMSPFSTPRGANGAITGDKTGGFGFHTDLEDNPWWTVDLGSLCDLHACLIFNRMDGGAERSRSIQVHTSVDGEQWQCRYSHAGRPPFGGLRPYDGHPPLLVELYGITARYVRLQLAGRTYLHLDEVEVYGAPVR